MKKHIFLILLLIFNSSCLLKNNFEREYDTFLKEEIMYLVNCIKNSEVIFLGKIVEISNFSEKNELNCAYMIIEKIYYEELNLKLESDYLIYLNDIEDSININRILPYANKSFVKVYFIQNYDETTHQKLLAKNRLIRVRNGEKYIIFIDKDKNINGFITNFGDLRGYKLGEDIHEKISKWEMEKEKYVEYSPFGKYLYKFQKYSVEGEELLKFLISRLKNKDNFEIYYDKKENEEK